MTSSNRSYYQILGVSEDASFEEVRAAFRERAREFHPDLNPGPDAVERMQEVNEAYEVLRDEEQRAAYDRMHRSFGAPTEELDRARIIATTVLGEMAFFVGRDIALGVSDIRRVVRRVHDIPTGTWHAAYESALESTLAGRAYTETYAEAWAAARRAIGSEPARLAFRHALAERAQTFTERFAVDIEVDILGSVAAAIGAALGRQGIQESLPASAWNRASDATRQSISRSVQLRGGSVSPADLNNGAFTEPLVDDAVQAANSVLMPYLGNTGRAPYRGGAVASSAGVGAGCAANIIGTIIMIGLVVLIGSLCRAVFG